jgi:sporadic carbohydrate cluster 2OG-Fe(II) oxygenase
MVQVWHYPGAMTFSFQRPEDAELAERYRRMGVVAGPAEDREALDAIRDRVVKVACEWLEKPAPDDPKRFLDNIGEVVPVPQLNEFRLAMITGMNATPWLRPAYFSVARRALESIVGNELCMQRQVNLSIQLPGDDSSLLPVHADVWAGDSPFEAVLWLPLVDCYRTKSMFLLPPKPNLALQRDLARFSGKGTEDIFRAIERDLTWVEVPYGHFLLFNQNLAHGNRVNEEPEARWTMNCRFKGVFTPYAEKRLGEFFEPITLRPASRVGLDYELPGGFEE